MDASSSGQQPGTAPRRVTGADVARLAGVSKTAVSQVFGGTGRISAETARRVEVAAAELGYVPAHAARSLRLGRTGLLTMIIPQVDNPYYLEIFAGAQATAAERGYSINLFVVADAAAARFRLRQLGTGSVDGVVVTGDNGLGRLAEDLRALRERGIAVAVTHAPGLAPDIPGVLVDLEHGAKLAVRHLVELGHERIAYVGNRAVTFGRARSGRESGEGVGSGSGSGSGDSSDRGAQGGGEGRWRGYRAALEEAGIGYDEALVFSAEPTAQGGAACAAALTARGDGPAPTAVFAFNDLAGMGILHGLAMAGVQVPAQMSVVGFDGLELAAYAVPALTTIAHPRSELGRQAVSRLCDQLDGRPTRPDCVLTPSLVVRGSSGRLR